MVVENTEMKNHITILFHTAQRIGGEMVSVLASGLL